MGLQAGANVCLNFIISFRGEDKIGFCRQFFLMKMEEINAR